MKDNNESCMNQFMTGTHKLILEYWFIFINILFAIYLYDDEKYETGVKILGGGVKLTLKVWNSSKVLSWPWGLTLTFELELDRYFILQLRLPVYTTDITVLN